MNIALRWRALIAGCIFFIAVIFVLPSFPRVERVIGKVLPDKYINLGLDLKGGIHLTLEVDVQKAMDNSLTQMGDDLRAEARDKQILLLRPRLLENNKLQVTLLKKEQLTAVENLLDEDFEHLQIDEEIPQEGSKMLLTLMLTPQYKNQLSKMTLDQAVKTIRNRIDEFGVAEPDIRKQQGNRIQVQLPGISDNERAIEIIKRTAHLEFKLVDDSVDLQKAVKGILPPGTELNYIYEKQPDGTLIKTQPVVLKKEVLFTGQYISDARAVFNEYGQPYVAMDFNSRGARIFERVTGQNIKKRMAIVLDGKVHSAPVIQDKIAGGRASITGSFSTDEAHDLALVLRAGALPAPVNVLYEKTVGPSLGQESIDKGIWATFIGGVLVIIFMVIYYGFAGLVADIVLIFNIILIMAGLAGFGATLTLPGIAGIILTIGMAVDANVLIFERIREELRRGYSPRQAVDEGFGRATLTILDANVTTIIAAAILYQFGTGPIRGFAVTLTLGILASMFTAIFVSRIFFDTYVSMSKSKAKLSI